MRPVRFVALSEDGHALVLADEVGRLLALPVDDRVATALRPDRGPGPITAGEDAPSLAPRDIQARIRSGESAEDVARIAGVPVDRVLRYAGPVLQERAMLAQYARRTRVKTSEKGASLAEMVDARLGQHGIELEKISWDAYRRDDGTWRIVATWPSGKANASAIWELDKARQTVTPQDDMAIYLCTERERERGSSPSTPDGQRGHEVATPAPRAEPVSGHEPMHPGAEPHREVGRPAPNRSDPIRAGRDAILASLDRPLGPTGGTRSLEPTPAAAALGDTGRRRTGRPHSPYDDDRDVAHEIPAVPSLAVLRPRRTAPAEGGLGDKPRKRAPSWDDVLFGSAPTARDA
jgi:Protein of unknown function (DUF3071)